MNSRRTYISVFLLLAIVAPAVVAAINVTVDPWGYFGTKLIPGLNVLKPEMGFHEKELKAHRVAALRPDGLVLGASTSDVGLDPEHPGWSAETVYNLAAGASSISLVHQYLMHALESQRPSQVVLGLELGMFNPARQAAEGLNPAALAVTESGERNREYLALNFFANAFSVDMLASSYLTVIANRNNPVLPRNHRQHVSPTGMMNPENFKVNQWKTYRQRFQTMVTTSITKFWAPHEAFNEIENFENDPAFGVYERILRLACENEIDLHIVLSPAHAYLLTGQEAAGLTGLWERWQKALVAAATNVPESLGCKAIPVWDFSGYNTITTEVIAASKNPADQPQWYWDPIHYRKEVGDAMLNVVFNQNGNSIAADFGTRLTPANIDEHIAQNRERAADYRASHADEVAMVYKTAEAALRDSN